MGGVKGVSGNPRGRPKGSKSKATLASMTALANALKDKTTPLEFLLGVMCSEKVPLPFRIDAAKAAAPYVHRKMPQHVQLSGNVNQTHKGGVMLVPSVGTGDDWERAARTAQEQLIKAAAE